MNLNFEQVIQNLRRAFQNILSYRVLVSSATEKVADLPLIVVIIAVLMAPPASVIIALIALLTGHRPRLERDYIIKT
ncbi:MAG: DUF4342 domain-containing protein [Clostridia bacterium]|nr:DUF4342 domain-containing protein [Clostridia bacterium]